MEDSALKTKNQLARISAKINQLKKKYPTFEETYHFTDAKISNSASMELKTRKNSMDLKSHKQSIQKQNRQGSCSKSFYKDELNDLKKQIISSMKVKDIQPKSANVYQYSVSNTKMKHISNPSIHLYELDKSNNFIAIKQKQKTKQDQRQEQKQLKQCQIKQMQEQINSLTSLIKKLQNSFQKLQKQTLNKVQSIIQKHDNQKCNQEIATLVKQVKKLEENINSEKCQRENLTEFLMTEIKDLKESLQKNSSILQDQQQKFRSQFDSISFSSLPMQFNCSQQTFQELQIKFKKQIFDLRNQIELIYHKIDQEEYRNKALKNLSLNSNRSTNKQNNGPSSATARDQKTHKFQQKVEKDLKILSQRIVFLQEKLVAEEQIQSKSYQIFQEYNQKVISIQESLKNLQFANKSMLSSHQDLQKQYSSTKAHLDQLQVKFTSFNIIFTDLENNIETQLQQNKEAATQQLIKFSREFEQRIKIQDQKYQNICRFIQGLSREAISKCDFIWTDFQNFKMFASEKWRQVNQCSARIDLFSTKLNQTKKTDSIEKKQVQSGYCGKQTQMAYENAREQELEKSFDQLNTEQNYNQNEFQIKGVSSKTNFLQQLTKNSLVLKFALKD